MLIDSFKGCSLIKYKDIKKWKEELEEWRPKPRTYKDSTAYYRFILPVWTETFIDTDDLMPCIEDD